MNRDEFTAAEIEMLGLRDGECECCWIVDAIGLHEFIAKRVAESHKPKHEARPPHPSTQIGRLNA